jgi:hypothetical protein
MVTRNTAKANIRHCRLVFVRAWRPQRTICDVALWTLLCAWAPQAIHARTPADSAAPIEAVSPDAPESHQRILGVIPNYQTVSDPNLPYVPLRMRDKWKLFLEETADPFTIGSAAAGAAIAQIGNGNPRYGDGFKPWLQRFGAAQADITTQNFFQDTVLSSLFREDPRYFRKGRGSSVLNRAAYALSRAVITRRDSGCNSFNFSGILGMGMGIALSDAYYPSGSRGARELESRIGTSLAASALGNLLPEFWPDFKQKIARHKQSAVATQ